ncbi:MAG: sigma-70 family RNA polymerase sigma factor [Ruminococcus sp.]|nr:sigma-70 family RNA polymerase sigma factor [Ruminococcus sp.]
MTNEELAIQIQLGHTEHYGELWAKCRKLLFMLLRQRVSGLRLPNYITPDDLEQEMYFALCRAVQSYDDTKPFSFTSYLNYSVTNVLRDFLPAKLMPEYSYNQTIPNDDGESELIDFIEDESAQHGYERIELTDLQRITRQAVAELPRREGEAVRLFYFYGMTHNQIAERKGVNVEIIRSRKRKGIEILRRNRALLALHDEYQSHYSGKG